MKNRLLASLPIILLNVFLLIALLTFAHACDAHDGTWGACHYARKACIAITVVTLILEVIALFTAAQLRTGLNIAVFANAILLICIPTFVIGVCVSPTMHCHAVMRPTILVVAIVMGVIALARDIYDFVANGRREFSD